MFLLFIKFCSIAVRSLVVPKSKNACPRHCPYCTLLIELSLLVFRRLLLVIVVTCTSETEKRRRRRRVQCDVGGLCTVPSSSRQSIFVQQREKARRSAHLFEMHYAKSLWTLYTPPRRNCYTALFVTARFKLFIFSSLRGRSAIGVNDETTRNSVYPSNRARSLERMEFTLDPYGRGQHRTRKHCFSHDNIPKR